METAVIILNYIKYEETLDSVKRIIQLKVDYPIFVIDNYSPNNSYQILRMRLKQYHNVFLYQTQRNGGYSYGNNAGIRWALERYPSLKYIIIQNPDVEILDKDIYKHLTEILNKFNDVKVVSGLCIYNNVLSIKDTCWKLPTKRDIIFSSLFFNVQSLILLSCEKMSVSFVDVISGDFFIFSTDILKNGKLFDENIFLYNEENVIANKLRKQGFKEAISLKDYYKHNHSVDKTNNNFRYRLHFLQNLYKSNIYLLRKYYNANLFDCIFCSLLSKFAIFKTTLKYIVVKK